MHSSSSEALDCWQWDAGQDDYIKSQPLPREAEEAIADGVPLEGMTIDEFNDIVGDERFADGLARAAGFAADVSGINAMRIDTGDVRYHKAAAVVYQRLIDSPLGGYIKRIHSRDLVDLLIVGSFAAPYLWGIKNEIQGRSKAKAAPAVVPESEEISSEGAV